MKRRWFSQSLVAVLAVVLAGCDSGTPTSLASASGTSPSALPSSTSTSRSGAPGVPNPQASLTPSSPPTALTGQVAQCPKGSTPNRAGPAKQERPALGYNNPQAAMDTESGRVVVWDAESMSTWTLDVCTNTWKAMKPAQEPRPMVRRLVYDARWGVVIAFTDPTFDAWQVTGVWIYVVDTNTWTELPSPMPAHGIWEYSQQHLVYDSRSGMVLSLDMATMALWAYELGRNTWTKVPQTGQVPGLQQVRHGPHGRDLRDVCNVPYHSFLSYDSVAGRVVLALPGHETWLFNPTTGVWTKEASTPQIPVFDHWGFERGTEVTFDAAHKRTVIYSLGLLSTYDAATRTWTTVPGIPTVSPAQQPDQPLKPSPMTRSGHTLIYDPINKRVLMFGGSSLISTDPMARGHWRDNDDILAYDLKTHTWTTIVPATSLPATRQASSLRAARASTPEGFSPL